MLNISNGFLSSPQFLFADKDASGITHQFQAADVIRVEMSQYDVMEFFGFDSPQRLSTRQILRLPVISYLSHFIIFYIYCVSLMQITAPATCRHRQCQRYESVVRASDSVPVERLLLWVIFVQTI
jgi:hypothetical protein